MIKGLETMIDVYDSISGDFTLDWSEDHCIAVATSQHVLLYDLNPLKNICIPKTSFNIQVIECGSDLNHNHNIEGKLTQFNKLRAVPSKAAASPSVESYKLFLSSSLYQIQDNDQLTSAGSCSVKFSPISCSRSGSTILAVLDKGHRLILCSRYLNGLTLGWSKICDLSEILIKALNKDENLYQTLEISTALNDWQSILTRKFVECICCFGWSEIYKVCNKKYVYMATTTRSNHIFIWKLNVPISTGSELSIQNYLPTEIGQCSCVTSSRIRDENSLHFAFGSIDGRIKCIKISVEKKVVETSSLIWSEKDEISISDICWSSFKNENTLLLAAKGSFVIFFELSSSFNILYSSIVKGFHTSRIVNIMSIGNNSWLSVGLDGTHTKLWLENDSDNSSKDQNLKCILELHGNRPTHHLCPEVTHNIMISPNHVFLASVTSRPKITATIQSDCCGILCIKCMRQQNFSEFITQIEKWNSKSDPYPQLDSWEFIRMQLVNKDFELMQGGKVEYKETLKQYMQSQGVDLQCRWYTAKILQVADPDDVEVYNSLISEIEKLLVIKQMIKVLKEWFEDESKTEDDGLPVCNIVTWMEKNQCMLTNKDEMFLKKIKQSEKYSCQREILCAITGEKLVLSKDAKWAITKNSKIEWPCCCLTFHALENFECRKCEICNCQAMTADISKCARMKQLLETNRSIYSGCSLV